MIKIDDFIKTGTPLGIAIGVGATVLAAATLPVLPALARAARPGARAAIKTGIMLVERGREMMAEASEEIEDIVAEARADLRREHRQNQATPEQAEESVSARND
ncbi:MAG: hypothetical protein Kow0065_11780 [Methylomicrobium sp.]